MLFPLQLATGALIWAVAHYPAIDSAVGGLTIVAPLHNLGAWLFMAFFVAHVYLTTTGPRPWTHLRAMVDGYDEVEESDERAAAAGQDQEE
ncbi:MAG: cytochrome b/b6 domain-containing protein [Vicinamibacteria bacterium]|nr:cytochrome b/b6 domain-containing protein [Vicinamibacteria bacterium]